MRVQRQVRVEDFTDPSHRRLAELYWDHQRNEGEPVFNEFLSHLAEPALLEAAVQAVDEVETLTDTAATTGRRGAGEDEPADRDRTLSEAVAHLERTRAVREEQKLLAELRRTSEQRTSEQRRPDAAPGADGKSGAGGEQPPAGGVDSDSNALLRKLQENARQPDLKRIKLV
jgi:hypothetical protein